MTSDELSNELVVYVERASEEAHMRVFSSRAADEQKAVIDRKRAATLATHRLEAELEIERAQAKLTRLKSRLVEEPGNRHLGPEIEKTRVRIANLIKALAALH